MGNKNQILSFITWWISPPGSSINVENIKILLNGGDI